MVDRWLPLSAREGQARGFETLVDGVPPWLAGSLIEWVVPWFQRPDRNYATITEDAPERLRETERVLHITLNWSSGFHSAIGSLADQVLKDQQLFLNVVDYLLSRDWTVISPARPFRVVRLNRILDEAGSLWAAVGENPRALTRRVSIEMSDLVARTTAGHEKPAEYLKIAWNQAYGRSPNASDAYRNAIRALESLLVPIVSPKNDRATLGTVIRDIQQAPKKFRLRLQPKLPLDGVLAFADQLALVWTAQLDRHGNAEDSDLLEVSLNEARDAVALATQVVHSVQDGAFLTR